MKPIAVGAWVTTLTLLLAACLQAPPEATAPPTTSGPSQPRLTAGGSVAIDPLARVHYVNVGQGDGTIWELPNGTVIVYDCGPPVYAGQPHPMLRALRDTVGLAPGSTIWALIASHGHLDHVGGCQEIFQEYSIAHVYDTWYDGSDAPESYRIFREEVRAEGGVLHSLGASIDADATFERWDSVVLPAAVNASLVQAQIVWPPADAEDWDAIGESSLVVRLSVGSFRFCFQGDISATEEGLLANEARNLDCRAYLIGHHGSAGASTSAWLAKMRPDVAVASFGDNDYGHPASEALCRVQAAGALVFATHRRGDVAITTDGANSLVQGPRETLDYCLPAVSYWTSPAAATSSTTTSPPGSPGSSTTTSAPSPSSSPPSSSTAPSSSTMAAEAVVRIGSIQYDAPGNDNENPNGEWVEIGNSGGAQQDLTGWTLSDAASHVYAFPSGFRLGPGSAVKVHTGYGADSEVDLYWGRGSAVWNNDGDVATLKDAAGAVVDSKSW